MACLVSLNSALAKCIWERLFQFLRNWGLVLFGRFKGLTLRKAEMERALLLRISPEAKEEELGSKCLQVAMCESPIVGE